MKTLVITDRVKLKKKILEAGKKQHERVIGDFRQRIKDAMENDGMVNEEEYDNHQQSFKSGIFSEVNLLNNELEFVNHELEELKKIEDYIDTIRTEVGYGAVVLTDKNTFFVSASIERFEVDGVTIIGLSVHSPLYQAMKGKKVGESFHYKQTPYTITEVF